MPELEVLRDVLGPRLTDRTIARVTISPKFGFLLRTPPDDLARALEGSRIEKMWRRGKFLVFDLGAQSLVINPMLGGRLHWSPKDAKSPPAVIFALELNDGNV
ncbi:MAG: DNA-formamidopyrimidine glycosylase family protein, partial [Candidatus Dormiibacterota bacterium]